MNYAQAIENLYALERRGVKLELSRVRDALDALGSPDAAYPIIHVAGTNGKGSICAMLSSCLAAAGHKPGLFTSPHLHRLAERVTIGGQPVREEVFVHATERVLELESRLELGLSFFECVFLVACEAFREEGCDWVVLETGLGGRLDATNTIRPVLTVISEISLDHTKLLGTTLAAIAAEKAGIIKRGVPLISGASEGSARAVLGERARELSAPLWQFESASSPPFDLADHQAIGLRGVHQRKNAALALAALRRLVRDGHLAPSSEAFARGLADVHWPGRVEVLKGQPTWILDAAHNPAGCEALADYLKTLPRKPKALIFGVMADKAYAEMLDTLAPVVERIVLTRPEMDRAADPAAITAPQGALRFDSWREALRWTEQHAEPEDTLVACGSIFLMAAVRAELLGIESDPAIRM